MVASSPITDRGIGGGGFRGERGVGGGKGGRGGCPMKRSGGRGGGKKGKTKVVVEKHNRHDGVFIAKGKTDALCTKNLVPIQKEDGTKIEYCVWNPFRSKLAAAVLCGVVNIWIDGVVFAVEFSQSRGRDLVKMAEKRTNVTPIIEDARDPAKYKMLVGMVDVIVSDVAQPEQARILALNASHFLKAEGHFVTFIKANCNDSTVPAEAVFAREVKKLQVELLKPSEQVSLDPFERDQACVIGGYRGLESALSRITIL